MKNKIFSRILALICGLTFSQFGNTQTFDLQAPPTIVITSDFPLDLNELVNVNSRTFGKIANDKSQVQDIQISEKRCLSMCEKNPCINYFPFKSFCNEFEQHYDSLNPSKIYPINFGKDGYIENLDYSTLKIELLDHRVKSIGNRRHGLIERIFYCWSSSHILYAKFQNIWVIDCDFTGTDTIKCPFSLNLPLQKDCQTTVHLEDLLEGDNYCYPDLRFVIRDWITNIRIDRDLTKEGIQLNAVDSNLLLFSEVDDPQKLTKCRSYIKVSDLTPPEIIYPDTVWIENPNSIDCFSNFVLDKPNVIDNCSKSIELLVQLNGSILQANNKGNYPVTHIPFGKYILNIIATDESKNRIQKDVVVLVLDPPALSNCKKSFTIALFGTGISRIHASQFNDGSFDACASQAFLKVIRDDNLQGTINGTIKSQTGLDGCPEVNGDDDKDPTNGQQIFFDDTVKFCCADRNLTKSVILRAFDIDPGKGPIHPDSFNLQKLKGRFTDCRTNIQIQDKSFFGLRAPSNMVVSCDFAFDEASLYNPNDPTFGRIVPPFVNREPLITLDKVCPTFCIENRTHLYPPFDSSALPNNQPAQNKACTYYHQFFDMVHSDRKYQLNWGNDGMYGGDCYGPANLSIQVIRSPTQSRIIRRITAVNMDGTKAQEVEQLIYFVGCKADLHIDSNFCNDPQQSDLIWPEGVCGSPLIIRDCQKNIGPNHPYIGTPYLYNQEINNCGLISISYTDELHHKTPNACLEIIRTWVVKDTYHYDSISGSGIWKAKQYINFVDTEMPNLDITINAQTTDSLNGFAHMNLEFNAMDNCTDDKNITYEYLIDEDSDGHFDYHVGPLSKDGFAQNKIPAFTDNPRADNPNKPFDASGNYKIGLHRILLLAEDDCGNLNTLEQFFRVKVKTHSTEVLKSKLRITPNPAFGFVNISSDSPITKLTIYDAQGKYISSLNGELKKQIKLQIEDAGLYFLDLQFEDQGHVIEKLINIK